MKRIYAQFDCGFNSELECLVHAGIFTNEEIAFRRNKFLYFCLHMNLCKRVSK